MDPLLANVGKHNVTKLIYDIDRLAQDVGGGILATLPSEADFRSPEVGKYVEKYMRGVASVPTEDRMRMIRLVEVMTGGMAPARPKPRKSCTPSSPAWKARRRQL